MEQASCGACAHVAALHPMGFRGRGGCRLNGCHCTAFAAPAFEYGGAIAPAQTAAVERGEVFLPAVSVQAFTAILTGIAFVIGLLIGVNL